jgi:photosystem II stability/assembly factor-like uncharacterized protein
MADMNLRPPVAAVTLLVWAALACSLLSSPEAPPPTATPASDAAPSPTPSGGGVSTGFFDLNLNRSDQEGLTERANEIYQQLVNSAGDVDRSALIEAYRELANYQPVGGEWRSVGPAPIEGVYLPQGQVPGSGRINGLALDPRNPDVVYAAATAGGIWKSEDGGLAWRSLSDRQVPVFYGGLVMDPDDPDTLYGLLGAFDGIEAATYGYLANGIMRTRDGGATWELIGAEEFNGAAVTALVFDAAGTMYASSGQRGVYVAPPDQPDFGLFRSTDGGDTWERLLSCDDAADCIPNPASGVTARLGGFMDLALSTEGTLYASLCNVECFGTYLLRSADGGETWEALDLSQALQQWQDENEVEVQYLDDAQTIPYLEGLEIAISPTDPSVLLAGGGIYWTGFDRDGYPIEGTWSWAIRSTDGGDTWEWLWDAGDYCSGEGSSPQCTYDNIVEIDPTDANVMYLGGSLSTEEGSFNWVKVIRRSADGGDTWTDMTPAVEGSFMHPDAHVLAFDPHDPNVIWVGTDGGIYRTRDASADFPQWENLSRGLTTLLFVDIGLHPTDPHYILGGLQDNGNAYTDDGGATWYGASQGDAGYSAVDPFDPVIVYSHYPSYYFSRNQNGGAGGWREWFGPGGEGYIDGLDGTDNWLFYPPFVLDPNSEGVVYFASNRVYRSDDRGDSWFLLSDYLTFDGSIQTVAVSPSDPEVLYVGTTDGLVWMTTDGGAGWEDVTGLDFPPRNVRRIAVDPTDSQIAYAVFGGFDLQTPDTPGHVFRTTDGGASWEDISFNLLDAPLSAVVVDVRPAYAGVYVGGALGVWVLAEGSDEWLPYGTGMPYTLVSDLELNPDTGIMAAATFGRSIWVMAMP